MNVFAVVTLVVGMVGMSPQASKIPVILTTDIGTEVDDQWAMTHLAISPEIELKGVVTTHAPNLANPPAETSARFASDLASHLPQRLRPKVMAGSSTPLADNGKPLPNAGVDFLIQESKKYSSENRLTVLVIGAATDVGSAILTDPTWADRVRVVAMGFNGYPAGGDPWNVKNDRIAWRVVLDSRVPVVVGDCDVTRRHLKMTPDRAHTLLAKLAEPAPLLLKRFDTWMAENARIVQNETGSPISWPIWDEVTTAYLLGMAKTETRPRPRLKDDLSFNLDKPVGTIEWVTSIDENKLWMDLVTKINALR